MLTYIRNHELLDFIEFAEYTQYFRDVWVCAPKQEQTHRALPY